MVQDVPLEQQSLGYGCSGFNYGRYIIGIRDKHKQNECGLDALIFIVLLVIAVLNEICN